MFCIFILNQVKRQSHQNIKTFLPLFHFISTSYYCNPLLPLFCQKPPPKTPPSSHPQHPSSHQLASPFVQASFTPPFSSIKWVNSNPYHADFLFLILFLLVFLVDHASLIRLRATFEVFKCWLSIKACGSKWWIWIILYLILQSLSL